VLYLRDPKNKFYKRLQFTSSYKGAEVLIPKQGLYYNIVVVDAMSLYPSVGIKYNLSFDTINCECCKDNPDAKISNIMPSEFTADCKYVNPSTDWICKQHIGAFPSKLIVFRKERFEQKKLDNKAKAHALKILINGGYGAFGEKEFSFYDPRVAELVTATGRFTLSEMQRIAKTEYGFDIIYGDTDSLFLQNTTQEKLKVFQDRFEKEYEIGLEVKNRYEKLLLSAGKKHYVGYENGKIDIVGYEGKKSDRSQYQKQVFELLLENIFIHNKDPLPDIKEAFYTIGAEPKMLKISQVLGKDIEDVDSNNQMYAVAKAIGAKKGEVVEYYKADEAKIGKTWTVDPLDINLWKYKELLWNTIYETLHIAGYPIADLAKELGIGLSKDNTAKDNCGVRKKQRLLQDNSIVSNNLDNAGGVTGSWQK
jgi:DNA polymerase elongation subunit (family B)